MIFPRVAGGAASLGTGKQRGAARGPRGGEEVGG
jgi:hypothetical protein